MMPDPHGARTPALPPLLLAGRGGGRTSPAQAVSVTAGPVEGRLRRWACRQVGARVEVSADGATAREIRIHGGSGARWSVRAGRLPATAVRTPGSPTPEPSPSSTSPSTRARQRRPVRCGHSATSPLSKTWAPVHHRSRLRSPGPSASGTSPL